MLANNPEFYARTKHIDIQVHWIRKIIKSEQIIFKWILEIEEMIDGFTKLLNCILYQNFMTRAGIK